MQADWKNPINHPYRQYVRDFFVENRDAFNSSKKITCESLMVIINKESSIHEIRIALEHLMDAAHSGCKIALLNIGLIFETGFDREIDNYKAINYYIGSACAGSKDAIYNLSRYIENGDILEKSEVISKLMRRMSD